MAEPTTPTTATDDPIVLDDAPAVTPDRIMQVGMGFFASKTLLTAVALGLFTRLARGGMTGPQLEEALDLHPRATPDLLDALVALGFLQRDGDGDGATYRNTIETDLYLDRAKPSYVGGVLEMANDRLYPFWGDLDEAVRTGRPQNEIKHSGAPMFEELYRDPRRLEAFMDAMASVSRGNFLALSRTFDFSDVGTVLDVGGATGLLSIILAQEHPHLRCTTFDLPQVAPIAERHVEAAEVADRVAVASGDFFVDPLPNADVVTMGMILHDWDLDGKMHLIRAAYDALPEGGALIAVDAIIDDARRENAFGLLMSLNMLIEFGDAFDYTGAQFAQWCTEAGFSRCEVRHLAGPSSAAIAWK